MKRLLVATLLLIASQPARAQDFPSRDIRFLCGFAPGGTCDLPTRMLAEQLSPNFRVNLVAENRTGASGMIAADAVAKAAPDGHTVMLATMAMHAILPEMPGIRMPFTWCGTWRRSPIWRISTTSWWSVRTGRSATSPG